MNRQKENGFKQPEVRVKWVVEGFVCFFDCLFVCLFVCFFSFINYRFFLLQQIILKRTKKCYKKKKKKKKKIMSMSPSASFAFFDTEEIHLR